MQNWIMAAMVKHVCGNLRWQVDVRPPEKENPIPWREASPLNHLDDKVDSEE